MDVHIPFVNNITYLGVTCDRKMTWRHHIERTVAKVLPTYLKTYSLFKSGRLSTNIKLILYKTLIRSVMTYACPTWEYAADAHRFKLQCLQNRVLRAIRNLDRCTPVRELHVAFKIPYVHKCITKLCRTQAEVILNHLYVVLGNEEPCIGNIRGLNLTENRRTTVQLTNCGLRVVVAQVKV
jgi:hypothetical protein